MSARPRTVDDEQLFRAVARAISRVGPAQLTLAEVAAEAGITAPSIIQRFGSKRSLLLAFAARAGRGVEERFAAARKAHDSPLAALRAALVSLTSQLRSPRAMANNLAFLQMDLADEDFRAHAIEFATSLRAQIRLLLEEAAELGELSSASDSERLARAVHIAYNGALITWAVEREGTLQVAIESALELALAMQV